MQVFADKTPTTRNFDIFGNLPIARILSVVAAAFIFGLAFPLHGAELICNNSVEKYHGYSYLPGWDVRSGNAAGINTNSANAHSGTNSLKFDLSLGNGPQWAHETFAVVPGETNRISF